MHLTLRSLAATLLLIASSCVWATTTPPQIPLEHFANKPDVSQVSLSPDGNQLASLIRIDTPDKKGIALSITNLTTNQTSYPLVADNGTLFIRWIAWANNDTVLVGTMLPIDRESTRYTMRMKTRETRSLSVNVKTGAFQPIINPNYLRKLEIQPFYQDRVIDFLPDDPDHILMSLTGQVNGTYLGSRSIDPSVFKINLKTQKMRRIQRPINDVYAWKTDRQHRVRIAYRYDERSMQNTILIKDLQNEKWHEAWSYETLSSDTVLPMGFDHDPNILYIRAYADDRLAIFKVDLTKGFDHRELILANDRYDVDGELFYSAKQKHVVGLRTSTDDGIILWNKEYNALQKGINTALKNTQNTLYDLSMDERQYLVLASSNTDPGVYYLGDRDKNSLKMIAIRFGNLIPEYMAPFKKITYEARDGVEIEALLTTPIGKQPQNLPTIIYPHGGPISTSSEDFNPIVQFLVNRGYAVLQMNFRGSAGYGHSFMKAGFAGWGQEMQDDIEDGTKFLISNGVSDPNKICILGASYGGYAALMGAIKTPELYQCAISFAGVSDLVKLHKRLKLRYKSAVEVQLGENEKALRALSPVNHADKIKIPILLMHGDTDRQVWPVQSQDMYQALLDANKQVEYVELEDGNHYLTNNENRLIYFRTLDKFLSKYLPTSGAN